MKSLAKKLHIPGGEIARGVRGTMPITQVGYEVPVAAEVYRETGMLEMQLAIRQTLKRDIDADNRP